MAEGQENFIGSTVTSTRVRLARNLEGYPFPDKLSPAQAREIVRSCGKALSRLDDFKEYDIGSIPADEATYLLERHLISPDLIRRRNISSAFISSDGEVSVMINEEDHLREQYILRGSTVTRPTACSPLRKKRRKPVCTSGTRPANRSISRPAT